MTSEQFDARPADDVVAEEMDHGDDGGAGENEDVARGEEEVLLGLGNHPPELKLRGRFRPREAEHQDGRRRQ